MKKIIAKVLAISAIFMNFSAAAVYAEAKHGPEYSLIMDVEYKTSTSLKNIRISFPSENKKEVDTNHKMLLINGGIISNANIVTKNNRTLVPIRVISENINAKIDWDDKARKVTINKADSNIELTIGENEATINSKKAALDVAPEIINNYTYLPIRFVSENMNCEVDYKDTKEGGMEAFANNDYPFFFPTVIVEEKNSEKLRSESEALENLKSKLSGSIEDYKKYLLEIYDNDSVNMYIASLKSDIPKLSHSCNVGRYYVFSVSADTYLVNKYTDEIYIFKRSMDTRSIQKFETAYPDIFYGLAN